MNLSPTDLIQPIFVKEGLNGRETIDSLPGQHRYGLDSLNELSDRLKQLGIDKVLLFGIPLNRDEQASSAKKTDGVIQKAIKLFKEKKLTTIADVCLCQYTTYGECRILKDGKIDIEESLKTLSEIALSYAKTGVDYVAPSAVLDGQVEAIHSILDEHDFSNTKIMSYSAKFASAFYGPFRGAVESTYAGGIREYQLSPTDRVGALERIEAEVREGADAVIVKPALPYLDVIVEAKNKVKVPVVGYQVSGEYVMLKALNNQQALTESLTSIKRAGASYIITYGAAELLDKEK